MSKHPDRIVRELDNFLSNPADTFANAYKHLDRFARAFDESFDLGFNIRVDLTDEGTHYKAIMDLPGVAESDINIDVIDDNVLYVKANRIVENSTTKKTFLRQERSTSTYERKLSLPNDIDPENISAYYEHGILSIKIDKMKKDKNIRKVKVTRAGPSNYEDR